VSWVISKCRPDVCLKETEEKYENIVIIDIHRPRL